MLLETVTGRLVDVENPSADTICIEDIGWGLSRIPRLCGHTITAKPYNVAQHSILVADEVYNILIASGIKPADTGVTVLKGLVHDSAEVYTGDIPSPVKRIPELDPIIKKIEARFMAVIYKALNIEPPTEEEEKIIKLADRIALKIEAHAFMESRGKDWPDMPDVSLERLQQFESPLDSLTSYNLFMAKFKELQSRN